MKKKNLNLIPWIGYKTWFVLDLPFFIRSNRFKKGVELGAKAGRSMFFSLVVNRQLYLTGFDKWEVIKGSAYKHNDFNELRCRRRLKPFSKRVQLIKGEALEQVGLIEDASLDFIHYDLQSIPMQNRHEEMIKTWMTKLKDGGVLVGRDFRDFRPALYNLGIEETDIKQCKIGRRMSQRLEYVIKKPLD
ncbi:MAG: class I SAM-dependent methyltransferase [Bacteroidota bacterium]